jgi:DNA invertase Pin-like site-specific DNA recombinase
VANDEQDPATTPAPPALSHALNAQEEIKEMQRTAVKRAAIYVKANAGSSPEGAERETQMAESEGLCKDGGLDVAARYSDDPMSREEFQRMMADATSENPPFDHVVVWKLRYFAWSLDESVLARDKLAASGVRLLSVKEKLPGD